MPTQTKRFLGLNNVSDPLRLKFGWLQKADNINITDSGAIVRREGFTKAIDCAPSGAYGTNDLSRLYVVSAGTLMQVNMDGTTWPLKTGLVSRSMYWAEVNDQVFFNNGIDSGIITKAGLVHEWAWQEPAMPDIAAVSGDLPAGTYQVACTRMLEDGRETGASDAAAIYLDGTQALQINGMQLGDQVYIAPANSTVFQLAFSATGPSATWNESPDELGLDLNTQSLDPLPVGCKYITFWRGQLYAAQFLPESDMTAIWASEPLGFHLFDMSKNFILVPGEVTMLAAHQEALIIGTQTRIFAYDGEKQEPLADYGVVHGWSAVKDGEQGPLYFWSKRGLCSAMPFSNITLRQISVDCGLAAGAAIIQQDGAKRFVVALQQGGDNFNQRGTP